MLARILELPPSQRLTIYLGSAVLVICVYIFLFYLPLSQEITNKQKKTQSLRTEYLKLQTSLSNQAGIKAAIVETENLFNKLKAQFPERKESAEGLLYQVSDLGRESGLEVLSFRREPEKVQDLYAEVPVEMAVRGGYHQITLFFDKVRQLDRLVAVADINLKNPQLVAGQLQVESAFSATTYRLFTAEEQKKIAQEKAGIKKKKGRQRNNVS
ncbi:MAG: type 4a pilus biogenesis protein PilO [Candidatus Binatia bacterium]